MTFAECVLECASNKELVDQFNRLTGRHVFDGIYNPQPPIIKTIDEATGYKNVIEKQEHEDAMAFIDFVVDAVWLRAWLG